MVFLKRRYMVFAALLVACCVIDCSAVMEDTENVGWKDAAPDGQTFDTQNGTMPSDGPSDGTAPSSSSQTTDTATSGTAVSSDTQTNTTDSVSTDVQDAGGTDVSSTGAGSDTQVTSSETTASDTQASSSDTPSTGEGTDTQVASSDTSSTAGPTDTQAVSSDTVTTDSDSESQASATDTQPPPTDTGCQCSSGPCCDGCNFYTQSDNHVCESTTSYQCSNNNCGGDVQYQTCERRCQGGTEQCTGDEQCGVWTTEINCTGSQLCEVSSDGSSGQCNTCVNGCGSGACWPDCNPASDDCCEPDGTMIAWHDSTTDLCWQDPPTTTEYEYADAVDYCSALGSGWELPTINQLRTIVMGCDTIESDGSCELSEPDCLNWQCGQDNCISCSVGNGPDGGCYWKIELSGNCTNGAYLSSSFDPNVNYPWNIDYEDASFNSMNLGTELNVRCVRDN